VSHLQNAQCASAHVPIFTQHKAARRAMSPHARPSQESTCCHREQHSCCSLGHRGQAPRRSHDAICHERSPRTAAPCVTSADKPVEQSRLKPVRALCAVACLMMRPRVLPGLCTRWWYREILTLLSPGLFMCACFSRSRPRSRSHALIYPLSHALSLPVRALCGCAGVFFVARAQRW